jgi:uncharacterized protein with HEPN domain
MQRDALLLDEMIDAVEQIVALTEGTSVDDLARDRVRRDALLWNFTVLGEAAAQISDDLVRRHPEIPWRQPVLLRNRIVHGYWSIDLGILLATASNQLPGFVAQLQAARDALDDEGEDDGTTD